MLLWAQMSSQHSVLLLQDPILPGISQLALSPKEVNPPGMVTFHSGPSQPGEKWGPSWAREKALVHFPHSHTAPVSTPARILSPVFQTDATSRWSLHLPSKPLLRLIPLPEVPPHSVPSYPVSPKLLILPSPLTECPQLCPVCWPRTQPWIHT